MASTYTVSHVGKLVSLGCSSTLPRVVVDLTDDAMVCVEIFNRNRKPGPRCVGVVPAMDGEPMSGSNADEAPNEVDFEVVCGLDVFMSFHELVARRRRCQSVLRYFVTTEMPSA